MTVSMFIPLLKKKGFENFAIEGMHLKTPSCSPSKPVHLREGQMKDADTQLPALYPPTPPRGGPAGSSVHSAPRRVSSARDAGGGVGWGGVTSQKSLATISKISECK